MPPAGSTTALAEISDGPAKISDEAAAAALRKIGASATPETVEAYKTVGRWSAQDGAIEVALATTHQNDDSLAQALTAAQNVLASNGDDQIRLKAISSIATCVNTRISNAELVVKCANALRESRIADRQPAMNQPPQFNVQLNLQK